MKLVQVSIKLVLVLLVLL